MSKLTNDNDNVVKNKDKERIVAKRVFLQYKESIIIFVSLLFAIIFVGTGLLLIASTNENKLGLVIICIIIALLLIVLTICFVYNIKAIKTHNSLSVYAITHTKNNFIIYAPEGVYKIKKSKITRIVYKRKYFCNYGKLYICFLDKGEMLITLKNILEPNRVQEKMEELLGWDMVE